MKLFISEVPDFNAKFVNKFSTVSVSALVNVIDLLNVVFIVTSYSFSTCNSKYSFKLVNGLVYAKYFAVHLV